MPLSFHRIEVLMDSASTGWILRAMAHDERLDGPAVVMVKTPEHVAYHSPLAEELLTKQFYADHPELFKSTRTMHVQGLSGDVMMVITVGFNPGEVPASYIRDSMKELTRILVESAPDTPFTIQ